MESRRRGVPVDAEGGPIPWFTYACIAFLAPRIRPDWTVFEYGSGQSTHWWAARVDRVVSCEHDPRWYDSVKASVPRNATCILRDLGPAGGYRTAPLEASGGFDVVVIDGRKRVECARACPPALTEGGVIVFDNSDREGYREGYDHLAGAGFRRIDFRGLGPLGVHPWTTSVFYRPDNCLGI